MPLFCLLHLANLTFPIRLDVPVGRGLYLSYVNKTSLKSAYVADFWSDSINLYSRLTYDTIHFYAIKVPFLVAFLGSHCGFVVALSNLFWLLLIHQPVQRGRALWSKNPRNLKTPWIPIGLKFISCIVPFDVRCMADSKIFLLSVLEDNKDIRQAFPPMFHLMPST